MILRHQFFVLEYLIDLEPEAAAIRAGYSPHSAKRQAARLLRQPAIAGAIHRAMAERAQRVGITRERVLDEYVKLLFIEMHRTEDQRAAAAHEMPNEFGAVLTLLTNFARHENPNFAPALDDKQQMLAYLAHLLGLNLVQPDYHALPQA